ncbi:hypothetical protein BpHYR1_033230 [Brachionus plicatilis]|uniref:Uncharacterized protein n=1 Tax=Brachionus plicatilis TaxID=10195 RepID=A0A3M7PBY8_BRAPC|nr:hypothetical protein BpHYR1_033230 [Brachionus plicatilis]
MCKIQPVPTLKYPKNNNLVLIKRREIFLQNGEIGVKSVLAKIRVKTFIFKSFSIKRAFLDFI